MTAKLTPDELAELRESMAEGWCPCKTADDMASRMLAHIDAQAAEIRRAEADALVDIDQRDRAELWADRLAGAVGGIDLIGEHSNANCPWENAYDLITPHAEVVKLRAGMWNHADTLEVASSLVEAAQGRPTWKRGRNAVIDMRRLARGEHTDVG